MSIFLAMRQATDSYVLLVSKHNNMCVSVCLCVSLCVFVFHNFCMLWLQGKGVGLEVQCGGERRGAVKMCGMGRSC